MSEKNLLTDTAERIFADHCDKAVLDAAERGEFPEKLWSVLVENGLHEMALMDSGIPLADVFAVIKVAGRHALPLPLAESLLANRWRGSSDGFASVGRSGGVGAMEVPWGRRADCVLAADANLAHVLGVSGVAPGANLAGEPRDDVEGERESTLALDEDPLLLLALSRTLLMAGALERVLELSLAYATEREQFGRPISKFQAIQHNLAIMAAETAAAIRAADAAAAALDGADAERLPLEIAAGKARVGEACGVVAELAHQVHGAMGYTHEHQLHHFTRRLWAWRDEFGAETHWQRRLGSALAARGADALWDFLATRA